MGAHPPRFYTLLRLIQITYITIIMTLIKSISGIRGTIGGKADEGLNPISIAQFTAAYAHFIKQLTHTERPRIVVGRDARPSGPMVKNIVLGALMGMGCDVIDIDLATTPTTEMAVTGLNADGGIIITASHNPVQWNALKLLGPAGEFLNDAEGKEILRIAEAGEAEFAPVEKMGSIIDSQDYTPEHIRSVLALPAVDAAAIRSAGFRVAIDCVNSVGGLAIPALLEALGVETVFSLYCKPDGQFPHNPEPLPQNLTEILKVVKENKADVGFVVDPDVDRLAIIDEKGEFFGEEYTLVAVADYLLELNGGGNTVSNLSSTRALRDVTTKRSGRYEAAAVGEVNVVAKMKEIGALIGGEGNGGVIYPELHYGRDALVGIALFLTLMAHRKSAVSRLRAEYPAYYMSKQRVDTPAGTNTEALLKTMHDRYKDEQVTTVDGVKIDFSDSWVHMRRSNTEPIIRIYTEAATEEQAQALADRFRIEIEKEL